MRSLGRLAGFNESESDLWFCYRFPAAKIPGKVFPKLQDPETTIKQRGLAIRIERKPGSKLTAKELFTGHRDAREPTITNWLRDIEGGYFVINPVPESELEDYLDDVPCVPAKRTSHGKTKDKKRSMSQHEPKTKKGPASKHRKTHSRRKDPHTDHDDLSQVDHAMYVANLRKLAAKRRRRNRDSKERQNNRVTQTHGQDASDQEDENGLCARSDDEQLHESDSEPLANFSASNQRHRHKKARVGRFEDE